MKQLPLLSFIQKIRFAKTFFRLVDDPAKTERVFELASLVLKRKENEGFKILMDHAFSSSELKALYEKKYLAPQINLQELLKLPKDTLGFAYATHMTKYNLDPEFFPELAIESPVHYIIMRARQCHDIWHALTGYDISVSDELALQAFTFVQLKSPLSMILVSGGLLHMVLKHPTEIGPTFEKIYEGYQRGKKAKYLLGIPWEQRWSEPLSQIRQEVGL